VRIVDSYGAAHRLTYKVRGNAKEHVCMFCGDNAQEWALRSELLTGIHGAGRPYSMDPEDYHALCKPCHRRHDSTAEERQEMARYAQSHASITGFEILASRRKEDDALDQRLRETSRRNGEENGKKGAATLVSRRAEDPELDARIRIMIAKNTQVWNRRCLDCSRVSTPGGMAAHQRKTGHQGQEVLSEGDAR